jgi:hypothetical protein
MRGWVGDEKVKSPLHLIKEEKSYDDVWKVGAYAAQFFT